MTQMIDIIDKNHSTKVELSVCFERPNNQGIQKMVWYPKFCALKKVVAQYIGEVCLRLSERIKDHGIKPLLLITLQLFLTIRQLSKYYNRTTADAITIKKLKPALNAQEKLVLSNA